MARKKWLIITLIVDTILINLGIILAFLLRFGGKLPPFNFQAYTQLAVFITLIQLFSFLVYDLYEIEKAQEEWEIFSSVVKAVSLGIILIVALSFFIRIFSFPRLVFVLSWLLITVLVTSWRIFFTHFFPYEFPTQRVLVVGTSESAIEIAKELKNRSRWGYKVIGLIAPTQKKVGQKLKGFPIIGSVRNIASLVRRFQVERVIVASAVKHRELLEKLAESSEGHVRVEVIPELYEIFIGKVNHSLVSDIPLVELTKKPVLGWVRLVKKFFDFFFSLFLLILTFPVMILIAIIVKISSPGPVIYKQERVGEGEKIFWLYKFRTMVKNAEEESGPVFALEDDPRITPVGRFLRKYRLDELPQLYNILKGEMSFVGPRPERPFFVERFKKTIPGYSERFKIKPGVTGLAQVSGTYTTSPQNKLKYDLIYLYNQSFFLDLKILFQTLKVVLSGRGSR